MSNSSAESGRVAAMNHDAVEKAKVFTGRVHYFDRNRDLHVDMPEVTMVEVGKWSAEGAEKSEEDYANTYYAALLLGYELNMDWLPVGENGDRKYLIYAGRNEQGEPQSFTPEQATAISEKINNVLAQAMLASSN